MYQTALPNEMVILDEITTQIRVGFEMEIKGETDWEGTDEEDKKRMAEDEEKEKGDKVPPWQAIPTESESQVR